MNLQATAAPIMCDVVDEHPSKWRWLGSSQFNSAKNLTYPPENEGLEHDSFPFETVPFVGGLSLIFLGGGTFENFSMATNLIPQCQGGIALVILFIGFQNSIIYYNVQ